MPQPKTDPVKQEADRLLNTALQKQARLENDGVRTWGQTRLKTSYPDILTVLAKANEKYDRAEFQAAVGEFRAANSLLDMLATSKNDRFRDAMSTGTTALSNDDSEKAAAMFRLALALKPGDDRATAEWARAEKRPHVLAKMEQGRQHEDAGDLDAALRAYDGARTLDPEYPPARQNHDRVAAMIAERDYRKAISKALSALDKNRFGDATKALDAASGIRPKAPEVSEIRHRMRAARQVAALTALRSEAASLGKQERWKEAQKVYDKALSIDPSAAFAVRGKARAEKFAAIHDQIAVYVNQPDRLTSPEPLAHAELVLKVSEAVDDAGPKLSASRDRLRQEIALATKPRPVVLQSDQMTVVTVYRVGRLGAFREKRLNLRPGSYTAVGSRNGYRDVRVLFRVGQVDRETIVSIKCTERI